MNKKLLFGMIPLLIVGYYLFQNLSGNTDAMLSYLEESGEITIEYNLLTQQESEIEDEEELVSFTNEVLIPTLEEIIAKSKAYGETIEKEELKEVHNIYDESLKKHLDAEFAWLEGKEDEASMFYEESSEIYSNYEVSLEKLAKKWGVEIEWEEAQ
ncbi:hypothetical protein [Halalkalibacter urbisdiaboli]|uniref:hypothetical protein n=1 Tax=Halalkalibacter urbisdiaboli TaxID=1960589 RepID=UPI000B449972|nr:hypothetical protein [Halalkalibacter urbisdiaboli]